MSNHQSLSLLIDHFDVAARTPADVAKLKQLILQLAVRGRLVAQDPADEPAGVLLERIAAGRANGNKSARHNSAVTEEDAPYPLPVGWQWVRLGDLFDFQYGDGMPDKLRDSQGRVPVYGSNGIVGRHSQANVHAPCVVVGRKGSSGAVNLSTEPSWVIDTAYFILPPTGVDLKFAYYLLQSLKLESLGKGIKPGLSRNEAYQLVLGLPPTAEQHRIVARVDELLAAADKLAGRLAAAETERRRFHTAALARLTRPTADPLTTDHWPLATDHWPLTTDPSPLVTHFDRLYADPAALAELKAAVLQLAVMGRLVPQDAEDEPAGVLLERIGEEKEGFVRNGKGGLRADPNVSSLPLKLLSLPFGWIATTLANLSLRIHYGYTASADFIQREVKLLRITDIQDNRVDWSSVPGCQIEETETTKFVLASEDILIARTGGTIGKSYLVENPPKAVFASYLIRVIPSKNVSARYLKLFLDSPLYWQQLTEYSQGTGQPNVNAQSLGKLEVPLPPLAEQHRIVARVDELFALADAAARRGAAAEAARERWVGRITN